MIINSILNYRYFILKLLIIAGFVLQVSCYNGTQEQSILDKIILYVSEALVDPILTRVGFLYGHERTLYRIKFRTF